MAQGEACSHRAGRSSTLGSWDVDLSLTSHHGSRPPRRPRRRVRCTHGRITASRQRLWFLGADDHARAARWISHAFSEACTMRRCARAVPRAARRSRARGVRARRTACAARQRTRSAGATRPRAPPLLARPAGEAAAAATTVRKIAARTARRADRERRAAPARRRAVRAVRPEPPPDALAASCAHVADVGPRGGARRRARLSAALPQRAVAADHRVEDDASSLPVVARLVELNGADARGPRAIDPPRA